MRIAVTGAAGAFSVAPRYDAFPVTEGHASCCEDSYSATEVGRAVLGWDARDEHPALSDAERADDAAGGPAVASP